VYLAVLPFFHVTGMQGSMNGPLHRRHGRAAAALGPRRRGAVHRSATA
jgi:hypothetical protein